MFSYIIGNVEHIDSDSIVLECGGIGYHMQVSGATLSKILHKSQMKVYTHLNVREDGISLFGFATKEEHDMFMLLTGVTGIGPKVGLSVLSSLSPSQLMLAIVTDDHQALSKAPGVGKKTAQRIVMELKDKVKGFDAVAGMAIDSQQSIATPVSSGAKQDAVEALSSLGYGRSEVVRAVLEIAVEGMDAEQIIKAALKKLAAY